MTLGSDSKHTFLLPPYVQPQISTQITDSEWNSALKLWTVSLSLLLKSDDKEFAIQLCENASLKKFLETFIQIRAKIHETTSDSIPQQVTELEKKVLTVLLRSANRSIKYESITLAESLYNTKLFSVPFLLDFVIVYAKSNRGYSRQFVENVIDVIPALLHDFEEYSNIIINHVISVQQVCEKISSLVVDLNGDAEVFGAALEEMRDYIFLMMDIAITMDCLFTASDTIAKLFINRSHVNEDDDFISVIRNLYDATLPIALGLLQEPNAAVEIARDINILKQALVSCVYHLLYECFFVPLGFTTDEVDTITSTLGNGKQYSDDDNANVIVNSLNDILFSFIERSESFKPVQAFVDAPLLLDIEMEFNLSQKLTRIKNDILHGYPFDKTRDVQYGILSLESMRDMVQDAPLRRKKAEKFRRLSMRPVVGIANEKQHDVVEEDVRRTSLIFQVRDVFPDFGEGFIDACLGAFGDDVETVIHRILEDSLPEELDKLDRFMPRKPREPSHSMPEKRPLSSQRNIFNNDEFDVNIGKKNRGTAETLLDDKSFVDAYKDAIIEAAYSDYEDEYDDTYDTNAILVRGVDSHMLDDSDGELNAFVKSQPKGHVDPAVMHSAELIKAYKENTSVFERTSAARKSDKRRQLKKITQMTDEQIEGWFTMFQRNPRRDKLLEKYDWHGEQDEISSATSDEEGSSTSAGPSHRGGNRGRDVRRGKPRPGGHQHQRKTTEKGKSSPSDSGTDKQQAQPASRGYRGNKSRTGHHDRKNARAKKMGRAFGPIQG
ncbi:547_t:CDS:2 [Paraglomus occultum]|uniref:547_t:CDS:1 n=1 Tax=Paraglomus occultum TaxID=144539 RepID=A0A9N9F2Q5_9GLOM|nr:547_t:CDS:2 [Paraglomus occultum]